MIQAKPRAGAPLNCALPEARGLVMAYFFNEGGGATIRDVARGNHGTLNGATLATAWEASEFGPAMKFDGVDQYVNVPTSKALESLIELTIMFRCKITSAGLEVLLGFGDNSTTGFEVGININGTNRIEFATGSNFQMGGSDTTVNDGKWHTHCITLKSGTAGTFYMDGISRGERTYTAPAAHTGSRRIGSFHTDAFWFAGRFESVLLWNRALTASEVARISADPYRLIRRDHEIEIEAGTAGGGGTITADLSVTLGAATCSSDATHPVTADCAKTLDNATVSAAATHPVTANVSVTLGNATLSAEASHPVTGTVTVTLGNATVVSDATHPVTANVGKTLGDATLSADGSVGNTAVFTLNVTLGNAALSAAASHPVTGNAGMTLGNATLSATYDVPGAYTNPYFVWVGQHRTYARTIWNKSAAKTISTYRSTAKKI